MSSTLGSPPSAIAECEAWKTFFRLEANTLRSFLGPGERIRIKCKCSLLELIIVGQSCGKSAPHRVEAGWRASQKRQNDTSWIHIVEGG